MSETVDEILRRFREPWLRYGQGRRICLLYGLGKGAWAKMAPTIVAREPDEFLKERRYNRDHIIQVIEGSLPKG